MGEMPGGCAGRVEHDAGSMVGCGVAPLTTVELLGLDMNTGNSTHTTPLVSLPT